MMKRIIKIIMKTPLAILIFLYKLIMNIIGAILITIISVLSLILVLTQMAAKMKSFKGLVEYYEILLKKKQII